MINALSFDIEEYFQAETFSSIVSRENWDGYPARVVQYTRELLEICEKFDIKATFFILGWIAKRQPGLIREIDSCGHEIACHGFDHQLIYKQSMEEFRNDIRQSKQILEDQIQKKVIGYRAPTFSITKKSLWALDILIEEGFEYDSSIFPIHHDRYGIPDASRFPHKILKNLYEFPPSTLRLGNKNLPFGGGGYLRLFPLIYTLAGIKMLNSKRHPALVYIHPWEIDLHQPQLGLKGLDKRRHYHNQDKTKPRLESLLTEFKFAPLRKVLNI